MRLQNKTCIVTGAGAGIGFATARAFADEGATVIALDRDQAGLSTLARRKTSLNTQILDVQMSTPSSSSLKSKIKPMSYSIARVWSPREIS